MINTSKKDTYLAQYQILVIKELTTSLNFKNKDSHPLLIWPVLRIVGMSRLLEDIFMLSSKTLAVEFSIQEQYLNVLYVENSLKLTKIITIKVEF